MLGVGDAPTARAHRALTPPWGVPGLPAMSHELHVLRPMSHVLPWPVTANYRACHMIPTVCVVREAPPW